MHKRNLGNFRPEFFELIKKRPARIVVHRVLLGIPAIAEPAIMAIDGIWLVGTVDRNRVLRTETAFHFVKIPLIAEREAPLRPALRTHAWLLDADFLVIQKIVGK